MLLTESKIQQQPYTPHKIYKQKDNIEQRKKNIIRRHGMEKIRKTEQVHSAAVPTVSQNEIYT